MFYYSYQSFTSLWAGLQNSNVFLQNHETLSYEINQYYNKSHWTYRKLYEPTSSISTTDLIFKVIEDYQSSPRTLKELASIAVIFSSVPETYLPASIQRELNLMKAPNYVPRIDEICINEKGVGSYSLRYVQWLLL